MSSLMKGLLRPVVRVRIPGLTAPLPSINSPSTSLQEEGKTDKVKYYDSIRADLSMIHDEDKKKRKRNYRKGQRADRDLGHMVEQQSPDAQ